MRVAVSGAHGLTGGAAVRSLSERAHEVIGLVRRDALVPGATETRCVDLDDPGKLAELLADVDVLVHVAGILYGRQLAEALRRGAPRDLVVVSTASVYARHAHAELYQLNENAIRSVRPTVTVVRPTMIYGSSRDRNVHRLVAFAKRWRFLPVIGDGAALVQPIHYQDLADALAGCVEQRPGGTIDAGGGSRISLVEAARTILRSLDAKERVVRVPYLAAMAAGTFADLGRGSRWRDRVRRTREDRTVDNARLTTVSGIVPRTFEQGLADMLRESAV